MKEALKFLLDTATIWFWLFCGVMVIQGVTNLLAGNALAGASQLAIVIVYSLFMYLGSRHNNRNQELLHDVKMNLIATRKNLDENEKLFKRMQELREEIQGFLD